MSFKNANVLIQKFVDHYGNTGRTYRAIDFVRDISRANTSIELDARDLSPQPGKLRSVRINYWPILCAEADCGANLCTPGTKVEPKQKLFTITKCSATPVYAINKDDIRYVDNEGWDFTNSAKAIINSAMPAFRRHIAKDFVTYLYTLAGVHPDGYVEKKVVLMNLVTGRVNPMGRQRINKEYMDSGFTMPYLLGGGDIFYWDAMVADGGLNQDGQLINRVNTSNAYYDDGLSDEILNDVLNGSHILSVATEMFKFVTFSENAGIFSTYNKSIDDFGALYRGGAGSSGEFIEGSLLDPVTGLLFDLNINYDKCDKVWNFYLQLKWDFFIMPDVACNKEGVNGIMKWRTCPDVEPVCPTGSPVSSPIATRTYSWTPGAIFPLYIADSVIGGVANLPAVTVTDLASLAAMMNDNYGASIFSVSGSTIRYTGYTAISGSFNNGTKTFTFA